MLQAGMSSVSSLRRAPRGEQTSKATDSLCGAISLSDLAVVVLGAVTKLRKQSISVVMSVRPSTWNNWTAADWSFMELHIPGLIAMPVVKSNFVRIRQTQETQCIYECCS